MEEASQRKFEGGYIRPAFVEISYQMDTPFHRKCVNEATLTLCTLRNKQEPYRALQPVSIGEFF